MSFLLTAAALLGMAPSPPPADCLVETIVLGTGQDAGIPQIGNNDDPGWQDDAARRSATSIALIDHRTDDRYLFEATPDIRAQLHALDEASPGGNGSLGLSGVFLTHAHIGHYAGLMFFGHESAGTSGLRVHAMPRMRAFLTDNGPWSQLVSYRNILLEPLVDNQPVRVGEGITVTPHLVPHRDEYSETVGYVIDTPGRDFLFLPDIDSWDRWAVEYDRRIEDMVDAVDIAYVDATFFDDNELPGRDMSKIPHPRVAASMARFADAPAEVRAKIRFIHYNHTNPVRFEDSPQSDEVREAGFAVAREGERMCLLSE
ncbi:MBL fold metallo-hydrolase [Parvularcula marina]|uniref:MBL fold metallo-hydrolase n=1 Tax=Parvularcula marina TaxID=2292771 RepID=UPI00351488C1